VITSVRMTLGLRVGDLLTRLAVLEGELAALREGRRDPQG
jgi:hypothetical protein